MVVDLVSELPAGNYTVFTSNFFTSLTLSAELSEKGVGLTGTVRQNRREGCPINVKIIEKMQRESYENCYEETIESVVYME